MKPTSRLVFVLRQFLFLVLAAALCTLVGGIVLLVYNWRISIIKADHTVLPVLKTGGTSSASTLLENGWKIKYRKDKNILISYESTGSTEGIKRMTDKSISISFSHAPMTSEQKKSAQEIGGPVVQIPVVVFAVVPIYKIKELQNEAPLKLDAEVLAGIFLGKIKKWNAEPIVALNPEVKDKLPDRDIVVVHRKDSSGTTLVFTEYLHNASKTWRDAIGKPSSTVAWPGGEGVERNIGVANEVFTSEDSIGYIDLLYAQNKQYHFQYAAVLNKDGKAFLHAESKSLEAAIQQVLPTIPESLEFNLANQPGPESYPICGVVWASCYQNQPAAEVQKVTEFLTWILHDGQTPATFASYAPLPPELIARADGMVKHIKAGP